MCLDERIQRSLTNCRRLIREMSWAGSEGDLIEMIQFEADLMAEITNMEALIAELNTGIAQLEKAA